jgi:flagellar basal-body rod protein FlgF
MSGIIYNAGAGAILQQIRLDVYSNNLANMGTVGFKSDQPIFRYDESQEMQEASPAATPQLSPYTSTLEYVTDYTTGPIQNTGNPLDVAIVGKGFFEIQTAEGVHYSRNGRFSINEQGQLSNSDGRPVMGQGGEITIDGSQVVINEKGEVEVDGAIVDTLRVVDFSEPYNLKKVGNSAFVPGSVDTAARQAQNFRIAQGAVESSNVNAIRTMTDMIELLRVFESYQKVIRAADDTMAKTVSEVGAPV